MNLYFLVEGDTESEFYPKFLQFYFGDKLKRVNLAVDATANNYYLIGSGGYPFIYTGSQIPKGSDAALKNAILEINVHPVYDYLLICLDADELTVEERITEFETKVEELKRQKVVLNQRCSYKLVVQNKCIETWFLGNRKIFKANPASEPLFSYVRYYNVKTNDPELMGNYNEVFTTQQFHHSYLRALLKEKNQTYKKENPATTSDAYLEELQKRVVSKNAHLKTLADFISFCEYIKSNIK